MHQWDLWDLYNLDHLVSVKKSHAQHAHDYSTLAASAGRPGPRNLLLQGDGKAARGPATPERSLEEREERGRGFAKIREAEGQFVPDYSRLKK